MLKKERDAPCVNVGVDGVGPRNVDAGVERGGGSACGSPS